VTVLVLDVVSLQLVIVSCLALCSYCPVIVFVFSKSLMLFRVYHIYKKYIDACELMSLMCLKLFDGNMLRKETTTGLVLFEYL